MADDKKIIFSMVGVSKIIPPQRQILKNIYLSFFYGAKIGIIGLNGSGKSTLLKIIAGLDKSYQGNVVFNHDYSIGYLEQEPKLDPDKTVREVVQEGVEPVLALLREYDEVNNAFADPEVLEDPEKMDKLIQRQAELQDKLDATDAWNIDNKLDRAMDALRCPPDDKKVGVLSGGERRRVALCRLLLQQPDILLLDEPTNHLDLSAIRWLENFLLDFENTVIVVSHDRHFLNKVCTHICDVDFGKIQMSLGNYDFWYEYTQMRQRQARDQNKKNEQKIKELQAFIARFSANAAKSKQATSRKKQLDALEMIDMPVSSRRFPFVDFKPDRECGNDLLRVDHLTKTIGDRKVLDDISFVIHPREKVAFVGADAMAKTTLFKIIMGEMEPDEGEYKWGVTTTQSYFPSDNSAYFDGVDLTLIDWLRQYTTQTLETDIRSWLGRMLFSGDEALKKANVLSGGERVRCMLCKMMLSGANVLVLDEPTNHLDLESITALNDGLIRYPETILFTSHDHQFVQTVADRIIEVSGNTLLDRKGTYDEFLADFDEDQLKKY